MAASSSSMMSSAGEAEETIDGAEFLEAAEEGRMGTVMKALEKDRNLILLGDVRGNTALHLVAKAGDHDTVSKLIQIARDLKGWNVLTEVNEDGDTALHLALKYGHWRAAKHLALAQGYGIEKKDHAAFVLNKDGGSPFNLIWPASVRRTVKLLTLYQPVGRCCLSDMGMKLACDALEDDGEEDESRVTFTWSSLCSAARVGSESLVERILREDPNLILYFDEYHGTVLHVAVRARQSGTLQQLVKHIKPRSELHGVVLKKDRYGLTALYVAVQYSFKTVALDLIDIAPTAVYQISSDDIDSPFCLAVKLGHQDLVCHMIRKTSSEEAMKERLISHCKRTCLAHVAIDKNSLGMLQSLLGGLPSLIDSTNYRGWRPLSYAISKGRLDIVSYLLRNFPHSADKDDRDGSFPIHKAVAAGNLNIVKEILARCPQVLYAIDKKGRSILHIAVSYAKKDILNYLVKQKGIENISYFRNKEGKTFTDLAVVCRAKEQIKYLKNFRAEENKGVINRTT